MELAILSPHIDDAVLSLGATMHKAANLGISVRSVTVFAGDVQDEGPPSPWDSQRGRRTAQQAIRDRRREDRDACRSLMAAHAWGNFHDTSYAVSRDAEKIWEFITAETAKADLTLVPGWPLTNADHAFVTTLFMRRANDRPFAVYGELPYGIYTSSLIRQARHGRTASLVRYYGGGRPCWFRSALTREDLVAKGNALMRYGAEMDALGRLARHTQMYDRLIRAEALGLTPNRAHLKSTSVLFQKLIGRASGVSRKRALQR